VANSARIANEYIIKAPDFGTGLFHIVPESHKYHSKRSSIAPQTPGPKSPSLQLGPLWSTATGHPDSASGRNQPRAVHFPNQAPARIGRPRPCVTSVWPPITDAPISRHAALSPVAMPWTKCGVVWPSGSSIVTRSQRGSAPVVARSLAFTWTRYQAISSLANVIGSALKTSSR
jgi:hypothetical protein